MMAYGAAVALTVVGTLAGQAGTTAADSTDRHDGARGSVSYRAVAVGPAAEFAAANDINDAGVVVGDSSAGGWVDSEYAPRARLLGRVTAAGERLTSTSAQKVNALGRIAGSGGFPRPNTDVPLDSTVEWASGTARPVGLGERLSAMTTLFEVRGLSNAGTALVRLMQHAGSRMVQVTVGGASGPVTMPTGAWTAYDMAADGTVVGGTCAIACPAFTSRGTTWTALPPPAGYPSAAATAISPDGRRIAGIVKGGAVMWDANRRVSRLAGASADFVPKDVNQAGWVIGDSAAGPALWRPDSGQATLTSLTRGLPKGWTVCKAKSINASGDIAASECGPTTPAGTAQQRAIVLRLR